jgi:hypothetical protein
VQKKRGENVAKTTGVYLNLALLLLLKTNNVSRLK